MESIPYTIDFDKTYKLCRTANHIYVMTTKFWSARVKNTKLSDVQPVCCGIRIIKSRYHMLDGNEHVLTILLRINAIDDIVILMDGHIVNTQEEAKKIYDIDTILSDIESTLIKEEFNSKMLLHNKILLCPMANSIDNDMQLYLETND